MFNYKNSGKVLCIGGSTLNPGTLKKLRDSLIQTQFLEEWAIIFMNHCYFKLESAERYIEKINSDFDGLDLVFVYKKSFSPYIVEKGKIYITPDSTSSGTWVDVKFDIQNGISMLEVECISDFGTINQATEGHWMDSLDASGKERDYQPCIDKLMSEVAKSELNKVAGLVLCGLDGDGAHGIQEIAIKGGFVAVQDPSECLHPIKGTATSSMPNTALNLESTCRKVSLENGKMETITDWLKFLKDIS